MPIVAPQSPGDCFDAAARGGPDRGHLPHPGDAALRRLPRQRLRAVADPRASTSFPRSTRPSRPSPTTSLDEPTDGDTRADAKPSSGPTCATRRPWPGRGRSRARRASSTASAASRRATGTATSPTTRPTTTSWSAPAQAKVDRIAESLPPLEVDDPDGEAQGAGARLGLDVRPDRRRRAAGSARPGYHVAQAHLRHLNPFPTRPRRDPEALRRGDGPRDEPRPARAAAARASTSSTSSATTTCAACR